MQKWRSALLSLLLMLGLASCVTEINLPPGGYDQLDWIVLSSDYHLTASASHPVSELPFLDLPAGAEVQVVGADTNYAWLLVLHEDLLGWMPSFISKTGVGRLAPPVIIEPLPGCTTFLGATFDPAETWQSLSRGSAIIQGAIYRPWADIAFDEAWLEVKIDGAGEAVAADFIHVQLTPTSNLILFTFAIEGLRQGSEIFFFVDDSSGEPVSFQAAFFADKCDDEWTGEFEDQMPVGELKDTFPTPTSTPTPERGDEPLPPTTPQPVPTIRVTSGPRQIGPTREEIQALVDLWDVIHHEVDYTLDPTDLPLVLTGGALRQQEQTLRNLRAGNCYWIFENLAPSEMTGWQVISDNEVIVTMRKHWDGRLYCNGRLDRRSSFNEPFEVRYQIIRTSQGWRIAEKVPLDYQTRAPGATSTPRPAPMPESGNQQVCSGVYPTRLRVNGQAFLDGDRRNNVRSGAGTNNRLVGQIQPGETVTILDGPRCAESMVWWYVRSSQGVVGWTSEGASNEYWLAPLGSSASPPAAQTPTQNSQDQLRSSLLAKSRNSSVSVSYQNETTRFADALVYRLHEFQLSREGITEQAMTNAISRADAGDRMNGVVQTVWSDWLSNLSSSRLDPYQTDPGTRGMSPFRQLIVRMIQGRQGNLTAAQQRALYSLFTRPENPSVWHSNVNGVIGAINREYF
ncbi:MAG: SH3 domain-containing protein [Caldilineaceae bacterium]|nr:SH3 domain-containing protein [Caldilineaceae bacterium]